MLVGRGRSLRLLYGPDRPTAVFAVNDIAAIGAMTACQEMGIAVPRDLSIVGYDNTSIAALRHVWLTSIENASADVGRRAARALLERRANPDLPERLELVDPRAKIRGTTAPPAG